MKQWTVSFTCDFWFIVKEFSVIPGPMLSFCQMDVRLNNDVLYGHPYVIFTVAPCILMLANLLLVQLMHN
jgi:hypothetical protein